MNTPKKGKPTPKNNKWKDPFWANKRCEALGIDENMKKEYIAKMIKDFK